MLRKSMQYQSCPVRVAGSWATCLGCKHSYSYRKQQGTNTSVTSGDLSDGRTPAATRYLESYGADLFQIRAESRWASLKGARYCAQPTRTAYKVIFKSTP